MTFQEKRSLMFLVANTVSTAVYALIVASAWGSQLAAKPDNPALWSGIMLGWIPLQIVVRILVMIILSIINAATGAGENVELEDELDKLIDLKSVRIICSVFMGGFFVALGSQALGQPLYLLFAILAGSLVVAGIVGDAVLFGLYRRGV